MPSRFRRGLAVTLAAAMLPVLSACAASFGAATQEPYTPADGAWVNNGPLKLRNLLVVSTETNAGTLVGTIFNDGADADALVAVSLASKPGALTPARVPLPAKGTAVLGASTSLGEASAVALTGTALRPGLVVRLTFDFERAASVSVDAIVVERTGPYATVPVPSAPPSPSPSPSPVVTAPPPTDEPQSEDTASPEPTETETPAP